MQNGRRALISTRKRAAVAIFRGTHSSPGEVAMAAAGATAAEEATAEATAAEATAVAATAAAEG
jgi:hypothetical protein